MAKKKAVAGEGGTTSVKLSKNYTFGTDPKTAVSVKAGETVELTAEQLANVDENDIVNE